MKEKNGRKEKAWTRRMRGEEGKGKRRTEEGEDQKNHERRGRKRRIRGKREEQEE